MTSTIQNKKDTAASLVQKSHSLQAIYAEFYDSQSDIQPINRGIAGLGLFVASL
jgi:hypothetical protein